MPAKFEKTSCVNPSESGDNEKGYLAYWQLWHHNWDDRDIARISEDCDPMHKNILEVGCGDGRIAFSLAPLCEQINAIDLDARFIKNAQNRLSKHNVSNLHFSVMDAQHLSFENDVFDLVLFPWVLQMVQEPQLAVSEAFRVLKTGGEIFVIGLRSDADYDKIIGKFIPNLPTINSKTVYENPIKNAFGEIVDSSRQSFSYFFKTKNIALEAFSFALRHWYSLQLSPNDQQRLKETIEEYSVGEEVKIEFPADVYRAVKL